MQKRHRRFATLKPGMLPKRLTVSAPNSPEPTSPLSPGTPRSPRTPGRRPTRKFATLSRKTSRKLSRQDSSASTASSRPRSGKSLLAAAHSGTLSRPGKHRRGASAMSASTSGMLGHSASGHASLQLSRSGSSHVRESIKVMVRCRPFINNEMAESGGQPTVQIVPGGRKKVRSRSEDGADEPVSPASPLNRSFSDVSGFRKFEHEVGDCVELRRGGSADPSHRFTFDHAFDDGSTQEQVFDAARPVLDEVLSGVNGTVFAYGQTSSGKTHTMLGDLDGEPSAAGLVPRAIDYIFKQTNAVDEDENHYLIGLSFLEIYNEQVHDLLGEDATRSLDIRQDRDLNFHVPHLTKHIVKTKSAIMRLIRRGLSRRSVKATAQNQRSSRSHAMITLHVERSVSLGASTKQLGNASGSQRMFAAKLNLVDLAGSERLKSGGHRSTLGRETVAINQSLNCLANVIAALTDPTSASSSVRSYIPYRNSNLTKLLKDALGGSSKTLMFACINPAQRNEAETLSTLRYASRAKKIKNKPRVNANPEDTVMRKMQEELDQLRTALSEKDRTQEQMVAMIMDLSSAYREIIFYDEAHQGIPSPGPSPRSLTRRMRADRDAQAVSPSADAQKKPSSGSRLDYLSQFYDTVGDAPPASDALQDDGADEESQPPPTSPKQHDVDAESRINYLSQFYLKSSAQNAAAKWAAKAFGKQHQLSIRLSAAAGSGEPMVLTPQPGDMRPELMVPQGRTHRSHSVSIDTGSADEADDEAVGSLSDAKQLLLHLQKEMNEVKKRKMELSPKSGQADELETLKRRVADLSEQLSASRLEAAAGKERADFACEERRRVQDELRHATVELTQAKSEISHLKQEQAAAQQADKTEELQAELAQAKAEIERLVQEQASAQQADETEELRKERTEALEEIERVKANLVKAEAFMREAEPKMEVLVQENKELRAEVKEQRKVAQVAAARCAELEAASEEANQAESEVAGLRAQLTEALELVKSLTASCEEANADLERKDGIIASLRSQVEEVDRQSVHEDMERAAELDARELDLIQREKELEAQRKREGQLRKRRERVDSNTDATPLLDGGKKNKWCTIL